ncbi:MAG: hypothetical protein Q9N62_02855 [Ghiorsea sp.]|nr:hypothetical protein [Ghiorsea sp.]
MKSFAITSSNHHIRKVDLTGTITNVAGSNPSWWLSGRFSGDGGLATAAELNNPTAVIVDQNNNLNSSDKCAD